MKKLKILLALITQDNDYQREQAHVAEETARRLDLDLQVLYANGDAIAQTQQVLASIHAPESDRPAVVVVEPVGTGMLPVAQAAAHAGVGWVVVNRQSDYLADLRKVAKVPIASIDCDNIEVGRIQGRQFAALLPKGGTALYIEGPATDVSKQRRAGLTETLPDNIEIIPVRGKWTEESGYQAIISRLQLHGSMTPTVQIIGCQNDAMAMGARRAVETLTSGPNRELWLQIPFTGVDGVPTSGQVWVQNKLLTATVITPALTGLALEMLARTLTSGAPLPERTLTRPLSYPSVEELTSKAAVAAR